MGSRIRQFHSGKDFYGHLTQDINVLFKFLFTHFKVHAERAFICSFILQMFTIDRAKAKLKMGAKNSTHVSNTYSLPEAMCMGS